MSTFVVLSKMKQLLIGLPYTLQQKFMSISRYIVASNFSDLCILIWCKLKLNISIYPTLFLDSFLQCIDVHALVLCTPDATLLYMYIYIYMMITIFLPNNFTGSDLH